MTSQEENVFVHKLINNIVFNANYNAFGAHISVLIVDYFITHYGCHTWQ